MKRLRLSAVSLLALILPLMACGQSSGQETAEEATDTAEAGDRFSTEVSSPVADGTHVLVPAGSEMTLELDEPLEVRMPADR